MSIKEGSKIALPLLIVVVMITVAFGAVVQVSTPVAAAPDPLDPTTIPKWENQLTGPPPVYVSDYEAVRAADSAAIFELDDNYLGL